MVFCTLGLTLWEITSGSRASHMAIARHTVVVAALLRRHAVGLVFGKESIGVVRRV